MWRVIGRACRRLRRATGAASQAPAAPAAAPTIAADPGSLAPDNLAAVVTMPAGATRLVLGVYADADEASLLDTRTVDVTGEYRPAWNANSYPWVTSGTPYYLDGTASNAGGAGPASGPVEIDTPATPPGPPEGLAVTNVTDNGDGTYDVTVGWSPPGSGPTPDSYNLYVNGGLSTNTLATSADFNPVSDGDTLGVTSVNGGGESSAAEVVFHP